MPSHPSDLIVSGCIHCDRLPEEVGRENLWKCAGCGIARYCSTTCQRQNWPDHKNYCRLIQRGLASVTAPDAVDWTMNHSYEIKLISIQSLRLHESYTYALTHCTIVTLAPRPHEYSHKRFLLHSTQKVKFEVARTLLPEGSLSDFDNMVEKITAPDDDGLLHALALLFFRLKDDFIVKIEVNPVTASLLEHVPDWSSIMAARIFRS